MQTEVPPALKKWTDILQTCRQTKNPYQAKRLHALLQQQKLETHPVLANYLVPTLAQCGNLLEAQQVFDSLPVHHRNMHSWNSLISGHLDGGDPHHAFQLYNYMQEAKDCVRPDRVTHLALLGFCGRLQDAERGRQVHTKITQRGLERDLFLGSALVGNSLVDMYSKCGLPTDARKVFDSLPVRNAVSWNSLITGYIEHGLSEDAGNCFQQMVLEGISSNLATFVGGLKACASIQDLETGQAIHVETTKRGLEVDLHVGSTLVDMYSECGFLEEAERVFDVLPVRDAVSWAVFIAGCAQKGLGKKAGNLLHQMRVEGIPPDSTIIVCTLKACSSLEASETGREVHTEAVKMGIEKELHAGSTLVDMYMKWGLLAEAHWVFYGLPVQDAVTWSVLIAGYSEYGLGDKAHDFFQQMLQEGTSPDTLTFVSSMKLCTSMQALEAGQSLFSEATKRGWEHDLHMGNALVDMYTECGSLAEAHRVFDGLPVRNVVSWNAIIAGYCEHGLGKKAWEFFQNMLVDGVSPDSTALVWNLKACGNGQALETGQLLHAEATKRGIEEDLSVGSTLVNMYTDCSSLLEARQVFDGLQYRDAVSWNALVSGYAGCGLDEEVDDCFWQMLREAVSPDCVTFVSCLKTCGMRHVLERGQGLYSEAVIRGLERDLNVGNALVEFYSHCGLFAEAGLALHGLSNQNTVSWNALFAGYAEHGLGEEVKDGFQKMLKESICPDSASFAFGLKACTSSDYIEIGQELHLEATKRGWERQAYLGSTLVHLYSKCSLLVEAREVCCGLPVRNVVTWNALIAGFAEHGLAEEVGDCLQQMLLEGVSPDHITFVSALKSCHTLRGLEKGKELHAEATRRGLERDLHVGSMLVDMYGKCNLTAEARQIFDGLLVRDVVSWNAVVSETADYGHTVEWSCFKQILEGVSPDSLTFISTLKACGAIQDVETGQRVHIEAIKWGVERELPVSSTLVNMYTDCGLHTDARQVFEQLPARNTVVWNALIAGYSEQELGSEEVENCFRRMLLDGVLPDPTTFICFFKACAAFGALETGREMHSETVKRGLENDIYVSNTLVHMYGKCGSLAEVCYAIGGLPTSFGTFMSGGMDHELDVEVGNAFQKLKHENVSPDSFTLVCSLKACSTSGALETGRELHSDIAKRGLESEVHVGSTLVDMYGTSGLLAEAVNLFENLHASSVTSWNAMIKAYSKNHKCNMAVQCFESMQEKGVAPNSITFICLLAACSQSSMVFKGQEYFVLMTEKFQIEPRVEHYACMVDLFARSGYVHEAERLVAAMGCPPSSIIIVALLNACKIYGRVELGQTCFQHLVEVNQEDSAAYLLMAGIYMNAGRWDDANRLQELRMNARATKKPGTAVVS